MRPNTFHICTAVLTLIMASQSASAQIVFETRDLRLEIGADARVKSIKARPTNTEYAWSGEGEPVAAIYRGGRMKIETQEAYPEHELPEYRGGERVPATAAALEGDRLTLRFGAAEVTALYRVTVKPEYLAFELLELTGGPLDRLDLLRLRVKPMPRLGPWINVACDEHFGICLCAGNIDTNAGMAAHTDGVEMCASATRDVKLKGAVAVLFGCPNPHKSFLDVMEIVERDFEMPPGARNRRLPAQRHSYLFCSPTPADIDQYIDIAKRAGFRTILYSYTSFTRGAGHYAFNDKFPRGIADLKDVAGRIRTAGLNAGMHIHYSKADRADSYVTPVPDDRLHQLRNFTLAGDIDEKNQTIEVRENPEGSARAEGRRILKLGKELAAYTGFTTTPLYRFTGCERGHLKTAAAAHRAGETAGLLDVDDWVKFIRFDQSTDIQDEAARRIAEIFNATGPYEMLYFDGAEDVHDPFWRNVTGAQWRVYRLLDPRPPVCETAMNGHFGWHMMSRGNAYDVDILNVKKFVHEISCREAGWLERNFTGMDFGWIFRLSRDMGPDVLEYVLSRGAAWDCPFSLRMTLAEAAANPRAQDCFVTIKIWEDARIGGKLTEAQKAALRTMPESEYQHIKIWNAVYLPRWFNTFKQGTFNDREHHLFVNEKGEYELVELREVAGVAGGKVKAYLFQRADEPGNTYAVLWAVKDDHRLAVQVPLDRLTLMRPFGKAHAIENAQGLSAIPVGNRCYLRFPGMNPDQAAQILASAR